MWPAGASVHRHRQSICGILSLNCCCDLPLFLYHWHSISSREICACSWSTYLPFLNYLSGSFSFWPPTVRPPRFPWQQFIAAETIIRSGFSTTCQYFFLHSPKLTWAFQSHRLKPYITTYQLKWWWWWSRDKNFNFSSGLEATLTMKSFSRHFGCTRPHSATHTDHTYVGR